MLVENQPLHKEEFEDTKGVIGKRKSKKNNKSVSNSRRVWRYQRGNQNPYIEEEQTTQWPKEKRKKDKQRSTKHTHKIKDRVTRTPLKTGDERRCSSCTKMVVNRNINAVLRYHQHIIHNMPSSFHMLVENQPLHKTGWTVFLERTM